MTNSDLAQEIKAWLNERSGEMLELARRVVDINSHTPNKAGVNAVAAVLKEAAEEQGLIVETLPGREYGDNLVARTRTGPDSGRQVLLCGHMDTVFPESAGFNELRVEGDKAVGPGIIDMKGGLVAALYALRALDAFGLLDGLPVAFVLNSDEEVGSPSSAGLIRSEAEKSLYALVFEHSGLDGETVTGRKGKATYRLELSGRAGHAGNLTGPKPSAVLELAAKTMALEALNDPVRGVTVNVGQVWGGAGPNVVADSATALVDTRYVHAGDGRALARSVAEIAQRSEVPGVSCRMSVVSGRPAMEQSAGNRVLLKVALEQGGLLGLPVHETYRGGVSDANLIAAAGVPVLDGLGPAGDFDHSPREYMIVASLAERAALAALIIAHCRHLNDQGRLDFSGRS